jgi:hypothetical protein
MPQVATIRASATTIRTKFAGIAPDRGAIARAPVLPQFARIRTLFVRVVSQLLPIRTHLSTICSQFALVVTDLARRRGRHRRARHQPTQNNADSPHGLFAPEKWSAGWTNGATSG